MVGWWQLNVFLSQSQPAQGTGGVTFYNPAQFTQVTLPQPLYCFECTLFDLLSFADCLLLLLLLHFPRQVQHLEEDSAQVDWEANGSTQCWNKCHLAEIMCKQTCRIQWYPLNETKWSTWTNCSDERNLQFACTEEKNNQSPLCLSLTTLLFLVHYLPLVYFLTGTELFVFALPASSPTKIRCYTMHFTTNVYDYPALLLCTNCVHEWICTIAVSSLASHDRKVLPGFDLGLLLCVNSKNPCLMNRLIGGKVHLPVQPRPQGRGFSDAGELFWPHKQGCRYRRC